MTIQESAKYDITNKVIFLLFLSLLWLYLHFNYICCKC